MLKLVAAAVAVICLSQAASAISLQKTGTSAVAAHHERMEKSIAQAVGE